MVDSALAKFLVPETREVSVGAVPFSLERLTIHRHRPFWAAMAMVPTDKVSGPLKRLLAGDVGSIAEALTGLVEIAGGEGSDVLAKAVAAVLDTEENYRRLRKVDGALPEDCAPTRTRGHYVGCDGVRAWVEFNCEIPQALNILAETVDMNAYGDLGKALLGILRAAMAGVAEGTPETPEEPGIVG